VTCPYPTQKVEGTHTVPFVPYFIRHEHIQCNMNTVQQWNGRLPKEMIGWLNWAPIVERHNKEIDTNTKGENIHTFIHTYIHTYISISINQSINQSMEFVKRPLQSWTLALDRS